jgi:hypothetical protein
MHETRFKIERFRDYLEEKYNQNKYLTQETLEIILSHTELSQKIIRGWFQNRRYKDSSAGRRNNKQNNNNNSSSTLLRQTIINNTPKEKSELKKSYNKTPTEPRRGQRLFSYEMRKALEESYQKNRFVCYQEKIRLARALNLNHEKIKDWFYRRRKFNKPAI